MNTDDRQGWERRTIEYLITDGKVLSRGGVSVPDGHGGTTTGTVQVDASEYIQCLKNQGIEAEIDGNALIEYYDVPPWLQTMY
jgi:hypothetical protein